MTIYYRLCDKKLSASKPSAFTQDAFTIASVCLSSFVEAFKDIEPKMVFICDYCPPKYDALIRDICPFDLTIEHTALGINETCLLQYDLYEESNEDFVLFQEYDYLWVAGAGLEIDEAIANFDFVAPYDHPDKYSKESEVTAECITDRYWKKTASTTATFGTNRKSYMRNKDIFRKYGYIDHERWLHIKDPLYSPLPSLATHMVADYMAPHVDWQRVWDRHCKPR